MFYSSTLKLHAKTTNRVFPESFPTSARTVPLSIIDATVANFGASSAIWFYDAPRVLTPATSASHWQASLEKTLNANPQWCGQLYWSFFDPRGNHTQRFGRLNIIYGTKSDPSVHLVVAKSPLILNSLLPDHSWRTSELKFWEASQLPAKEFFPSKPPLAMHNMVDYISLPSLIIQVTTFACGGTAIATKLAHPLADAHTLAFAHDWASTSHAMFANSPLPILSPIFDPQLLNNAAAGNIDATTPDPRLVQQARTLPCLRYDWWASTSQLLDGPAITKLPEELRQSILPPVDTPMPWSTWNVEAPTPQYVVHFSTGELKACWRAASLSSEPVSVHDALLAHIWSAVNRARGFSTVDANATDTIYMNVSLGLRHRLSPPLPSSFIGSPMLIASAALPASTIVTQAPFLTQHSTSV